jgi:hypothetical protein
MRKLDSTVSKEDLEFDRGKLGVEEREGQQAMN